MEVRVYNSHSEIKNFFILIKELVIGLRNGNGLAKRLFIRDVRAQYRQSILGLLWAFLPAIATSGIWIYLNSQNIFSVQETDVPYPVFVFTGVTLYQIFVDAVKLPLVAVNTSKSILVKLNFPREALLVKGLYDIFFNAAIKLLVLGIVYLAYGIGYNSMLPFAPLAILALILFGYALGLLIIPIGMLYKDIEKGIGLFLQFFMYFTPVLYPIPTKDGLAKTIIENNPLVPLLMNARSWLTTGDVQYLGTFYWVIGITFGLIFIGLTFYKVAIPHIIERIGS